MTGLRYIRLTLAPLYDLLSYQILFHLSYGGSDVLASFSNDVLVGSVVVLFLRGGHRLGTVPSSAPVLGSVHGSLWKRLERNVE